jgi:lipoyl(octanoyl) transferase
MQSTWLGRLTYADALALQEDLVARKIADPATPDTILLLEHEPIYTIGRTPDQSSLRDAAALPHPLVVTGRGGQATFHGPGQLIGYPILDLKTRGQDLHHYLRALEEMLIALCAHFGVGAERRAGLTGTWIGPKKIASIGIGVRRWISMHGFALNVTGDLTPYQAITPCGLAGVEMTSLARETGREIAVESVAEIAAALSATYLTPEAIASSSSSSS